MIPHRAPIPTHPETPRAKRGALRWALRLAYELVTLLLALGVAFGVAALVRGCLS